MGASEPDLNQILTVALELERHTAEAFDDYDLHVVVAGFFLHAISYARNLWKAPIEAQMELVKSLNAIAQSCEEDTDPIALAALRGDPLELLKVLLAIAKTDIALGRLTGEAPKEKEKEEKKQ